MSSKLLKPLYRLWFSHVKKKKMMQNAEALQNSPIAESNCPCSKFLPMHFVPCIFYSSSSSIAKPLNARCHLVFLVIVFGVYIFIGVSIYIVLILKHGLWITTCLTNLNVQFRFLLCPSCEWVKIVFHPNEFQKIST